MYVVIYDYLPMEDENFNDFESWYGNFHNIMFISVEYFLLCFFRKPLQEKYITCVRAVFYFFCNDCYFHCHHESLEKAFYCLIIPGLKLFKNKMENQAVQLRLAFWHSIHCYTFSAVLKEFSRLPVAISY